MSGRIVTVLPTARPWVFATGGNNAGAATTEVGYSTTKSDNTTCGGTGSQNNSYRYGGQHTNVGETAPHTVACFPGSFVNILYNSGTINVGPAGTLAAIGDVTSTTGVGTGSTASNGGTGTADYTEGNGWTFPTDVMPATANLSKAFPATGRGGLVGCFTDASGNVIANSFFDWGSSGGGAAATSINLVAPAGAYFLSMGINDSLMSDNTAVAGTGFNVTVAVSTYRPYADGENAGVFGAIYPPTAPEVPFSGASMTTTYNSGLNGVFPMQGGFAGLTWCKSIFAMSFGYFDKTLATPYSGQLFPTGASTTSSGQAWPTS